MAAEVEHGPYEHSHWSGGACLAKGPDGAVCTRYWLHGGPHNDRGDNTTWTAANRGPCPGCGVEVSAVWGVNALCCECCDNVVHAYEAGVCVACGAVQP